MDYYYEFGFFGVLFTIVFVIVTAGIIFSIIKGIGEWNSNNHSPKLNVEATCVSKRTNVTHHSEPVANDFSGAHGYTHSSDTAYYAAFEVESGDRIEFRITGLQYGELKEGDTGVLSFQGTRYLSFECHVPQNEDIDFHIEQGSDVDVTIE
jgi:hypothetical protein